MPRGEYDIFIFGNMSIGIIVTPTEEYEIPGGPILFATWTAHQLGNSVCVMTKTALRDKYRLKEFPLADLDIFWRESPETTSNRAVYQTESMETRILTNLAQATPYKIEEFPEFSSKVILYCGVIAGEIDIGIIRHLSGKSMIAIDVQGLMRKAFPNGSIEYIDWDDKLDALPLITYLKADAAEAAFLTGQKTEEHNGRVAAAQQLLEWGAKEVLISHHSELIAANESGVVSARLKSKNSYGRTGRGDTCFTAYISERFTRKPVDAIQFAAALTSIKMELPGPFKKTREEVEAFIKAFY